MAPNDSPFIVKRGEELPAGHKKVYIELCTKRGEDSQVDTGQDVPERYKSHCGQTGSSGIPLAGSG
jgi:hypothetical protein